MIGHTTKDILYKSKLSPEIQKVSFKKLSFVQRFELIVLKTLK